MNSLINATYELQRQYVAAAQAKMADFGDLDTAFTAFMNTNVCDALAVYGVTNLTDTPFSLDTCKTVSDSLLTKGYYFALTGYLESASALLAANPNTTNYNYNNRLAIWTS